MATISICAKILSAIASPVIMKAYEKGLFIWEAKNELKKLKVTIETIQAVLNDAENKQEGSNAIKNWIQRLKWVLYDAEDLFDEVLTKDLLKQQMMGGKNKLSLKNKVWISCSKLNPIVSRNSIAKKVEAIRERLAEISTDMNQFRFVQGQPMTNTRRENYPERCSIDAKFVIGRDPDKESILKMLFNELPDIKDAPVIIAIYGIGGMGKTTLAHLIYNDEKVNKFFEERWVACISDSSDDKEFLEKIYQSICEENCSGLTLMQLENKIKKLLKGKKYLLVLDDVWEEDHGKWTGRKNLLSSGANGSRIIVTTRLKSVVSAVGAVRDHNLEGLSEDDSWDLFKNLAFLPGYENDPRRESVGRELLSRCRGLPLAIWCMGGLLYNKTIGEWEEIERVGLPTLRGKHNDLVISILKLSYDHLPSNLKRCFTYCCLFPKDYRYSKEELIYHWIAQGYINLDEEESSFMHLIRMGFFQEVNEDEFGEIKSCKMHDIMHDLALYLSGEESTMQNDATLNVSSCTRYVSLMVDGEDGGFWDIPTPLLNFKSIRSCMLRGKFWKNQPNLDQLCSNFTMLRTLTLSGLRIDHIPPSIGELKLVRYLDLSQTNIKCLPNSLASLVNLLILNLEGCISLNEWPLNFKNLIKLRFLKLKGTDLSLSMPEGIGRMVSLQSLRDFRVEEWSQLPELIELLKQLRGYLFIKFDPGMEVGDDRKWQLPATTSLKRLRISSFPGHGIWGWGNSKSTVKLEYIEMDRCKNVKHLPLMRCLPILKSLELSDMPELEYIEEMEEVNPHNPTTSQIFFPCLEKLVLFNMPKLKGWKRKVAAEATPTSSTAFFEFSHLSELTIKDCPNLELKSFPQCPHIRKLELRNVAMPSSIFCSSNCSSLEKISIFECNCPISLPCIELISLQDCEFKDIDGLQSLHIPSPHLQRVSLESCVGLISVEVKAPDEINIRWCTELKNFRIAQPTALRFLRINSPSLVEWGSISNFYQCRGLIRIDLYGVHGAFIVLLLSSSPLTALETFHVKNVCDLKILNFKSPDLKDISIFHCTELTSVELESPFSRSYWKSHVSICHCYQLNNVRIFRPIGLQKLVINECPELRLSTGVDWGSLTKLKWLQLYPLPPVEELQLPHCLLQRHALRKLRIEQGPCYPPFPK